MGVRFRSPANEQTQRQQAGRTATSLSDNRPSFLWGVGVGDTEYSPWDPSQNDASSMSDCPHLPIPTTTTIDILTHSPTLPIHSLARLPPNTSIHSLHDSRPTPPFTRWHDSRQTPPFTHWHDSRRTPTFTHWHDSRLTRTRPVRRENPHAVTDTITPSLVSCPSVSCHVPYW